MRFFCQFLAVCFLFCCFTRCARKGNPSGGPKDEQAPIMVTANPPNESIRFNKKKIKIYFDEYITLKNLSKQLVISPPMKNPPVITPQGTPSKYIQIKLLDTLKANTTYIFNFGNAVQDNNENNVLESFKYVISTGDYVDSLTLKGSVKNALKTTSKKNSNILLYKIDSTFNDSIVYKKKPNYVANTNDSINFQFTNLQKGKYAIYALNEETNDYLFNPKTDEIGFLLDTISLPQDTVISKPIVLFKEKQPYKFKRGKQVSKGKIQFSFTGEQDNLSAELTSKTDKKFKYFTELEKDKDTLNFWYNSTELDSLNFIVRNQSIADTTTVKLRKKKIDSLIISSNIEKNLHLKDTFFLKTSNPILTVEKSKFSLIDKDSTAMTFDVINQTFNKIALLFDKKPKDNYNLTVLPEAISDIYDQKNDTLKYQFNTKDIEDYGTISIDVQNKTNKPIIIELLRDEKVIKTSYTTDSKKIEFTLLDVSEYTIRAIVDENNNKIWDTGVFLQKIQPERIIYFTKKISLRANWVYNEIFIIE